MNPMQEKEESVTYQFLNSFIFLLINNRNKEDYLIKYWKFSKKNLNEIIIYRAPLITEINLFDKREETGEIYLTF